MGFITGLGFKGWAIVAIVLAVLGLLGKYEYDMSQLRAADKTIVKQGVTIANQADAIKTDGVVAGVKDEVHGTVAEDTKKVVAAVKKIETKVAAKEAEITRTYESKPQTTDNLIAEQEERSKARIDSMWDVFCTGDPDATQCVPPTPPQGETHA